MQGNKIISDDDFASYLTPLGRLDLDRLLNECWLDRAGPLNSPAPQSLHSSKRGRTDKPPSPE
jgi:hypothetical protein